MMEVEADSNDVAPAPFPIVGIGASAGGLEALTELLRQLPRHTGMAYVLIQHLAPTHPSHLHDAVARVTTMPVHEITDRMRIEPDHVYVIPSNADLGILKGMLTLVPRPTDLRRPHLPIDFFFKVLAAECTHWSIGVVLSGTGADGAEGLRAIKDEGGVTFAQEPRTAKFGGMPEAAIAAGAVDFILPLPELARELQRVGRDPLLATQADQAVFSGTSDERDLDKVLVVLRGAVGIDFSDYKLNSVRRRLARRMVVHRVTTLRDYVQRLRDDPAEAPALLEDLLIHVTSFFRDPTVFEALTERVFPVLLEQKRHGGSIRVWSAGCSTGEEPYSLVIALREFLARENATGIPVQVFATDVSAQAIAIARAGIYSDAAVREVGAERLARHFIRLDGGGYQISKSIRECCAFVTHDLASDPPFSKLDLVSCRNLMIYLGPELQQRVLGRLHFALNYPGYLVLGRSENVTDDTGLFSALDPEKKIYARTAVKSTLRIAPARDGLFDLSASAPGRRVTPLENVLRQAEARLLDLYAPPGVIVSERMEILRFRGRTGPYLEPSPGEPQHDLGKMARPGLITDVRIALAQAKQTHATVRRVGVRVDQDGSSRTCDVVVIPLDSSRDAHEPLFAVMFEPPHDLPPAAPTVEAAPAPSSGDTRVARLEAELGETKGYLQSIIEDHQRTNDELATTNEEALASNEELQSLNEELQTAKEELQSTNEELTTLNEELQARNAELDAVNGDLVNILGSVEVPIVIVDRRRRIRRFTPKARPILNLLPADVGRPIDDIKPTLEIQGLDGKIADVIDTVVAFEEEVRGSAGHWFRLQIRPYLTVDKQIDGAVISVVDIDALKRAVGAAEWVRDYAKATVEAIRTPLVVLDTACEIVFANNAFLDHFEAQAEEVVGARVYAVLDGAWDVPELRAAIARMFEAGESFKDLEVTRELRRLGGRTVSMSGRAVVTPSAERLVLLAIEDVTDRRLFEEEREHLLVEAKASKESAEAANRAKDEFLAIISHELRTPLSTLMLQAELLLADADHTDVRRSAEAIERAAKQQAQLIDDLLDISRIVTGKLRMEMHPVSLPSIVREAVEAARPFAERKHLALAVQSEDLLPPVAGDPARLRQVVWNLLTNAIKFTDEPGRVSVTVDATDGHGRIRVRDNGAGIDPSFLPDMFQRFSQEGRVRTRSVGGLGLGLGIVRYVVEAHGGSVEAASEGKGKGATFTVLLPVIEGQLPASGQDEETHPLPPSGDITHARVLVVEDDDGTREALTTMLGISGAEVRSVGSAAEAMSSLSTFRPELLVCDIAMPDEDGYSLLRRIRALGPERGGDVPALALTAFAGEDDRRQAMSAGFQVHMAKPVDIRRLVAALGRLRR